MFADSMLQTSWAYRSRRSWTTLTSFGIQAVVIGVLLLIPLLQNVGLPSVLHTISTPLSMGRTDPGPSPQVQVSCSAGIPIIPYTGKIMAPGRVPNGIPKGNDSPTTGGGDRISDGIFPIGSPTGLPIPISGTRPVIPPPPPAAVKRAFRTSSILEGSLIRRVPPVYPPLAKMARVQGSVVVAAIISKAGTMEHVQAISGHPMLIPAAVDAVSQWRYKPYILNGEPIEVETQITVNFILGTN